MWMSLVAIKVWMRGKEALVTARAHVSMSALTARASPQMMGGFAPVPTVAAICSTARKSSREAMGKPASITSTPSFASCLATWSFSSLVMLQPGDCSPSRRVVSKTLTRSGSLPVAMSCAVGLEQGALGVAPSAAMRTTTPGSCMARGEKGRRAAGAMGAVGARPREMAARERVCVVGARRETKAGEAAEAAQSSARRAAPRMCPLACALGRCAAAAAILPSSSLSLLSRFCVAPRGPLGVGALVDECC
mmetsp:Transcript_23570/g.58189  ORF Transcript_23570/g.58189 Transcript_23570/m.58189 type:complete len:249 (-) Transcript_23570:18-764(-)